MATVTAASATDIQTLYVAYFNRPADPLGLQAWLNTGASMATIAAGFSASQEYKDTYGGKTPLDLVDSIYMNLFGRHAEAAGLLYWAGKLQAGTETFASIVLTIAGAAQNDDLTAINNKVSAAATFTTSLDTADEIRGYDGAAANAVAKQWLATITTDASLATATTPAALQAVAQAAADAHAGTVNNPLNLVLTTGVDTIVGGAGNDTITASNSGATSTLTGLDSIDGGAGKDTLVISDVAGGVDLSLLASVKNVEVTTVTSTGSLANNAADVSAWAGLTNANFSLKSAAVQSITAADTTAVTVSNTAGVTVKGGSAITVTAGTGASVTTALNTLSAAITAASTDADITTALNAAIAANAITAGQRTALETAYGFGGGAANPTGAEVTAGQALITGYLGTVATTNAVTATSNGALASAAIKGGSTVTITDGSTNSDQLKSVSLDGNAGAAALSGKALTSVSVANTNQNVTITNGTASHTESVTLNKVTGGTIQDAAATTLNVITSGTKSSGVTFSAAAATKVNVAAAVDLSATVTAAAATSVAVSGAGKVTIAGATLDAAAVIDASASTGGVTVTPTLAAGQNFIGGAGKDSITIGATTKSINLGAGDDTVTLTGALGTNGKVDGGAGNDTIAGAAAVMSAISGADAANLVNFETYKVTDALTASTFDVSQIAGLVNFVAGAGVGTGLAASATGLGANANVSVLGAIANDGSLSIALKTDTAADVVNLTLNHGWTTNDDATVTNTNATTTIIAANIETLNVVSTGTPTVATADLSAGSKADTLTNVLSLTDNQLVTLKVSGDQLFSFTAAAGQTKLATIDASANTAGATINAAADTIAVTIKGTAKADVITSGTQGDTITGGGGNDLFKFGAGSSSIGTGKFDTITDFVANTYGNAQSGGVDTGGAGTGANAATAKWTGDVLSFAHAGTGATAFKVDILTSAADATTYLANNKDANGVVAALDSTNNNLYVDNTGDGVADFYIHLTGVTTITAAAFQIV
ncbi:S-layer protein [Duganella sacchari]|uniref:S-layer protein n=1 Tax=Duganella sacchari TaxID=551987 RepID=A0A1M7R8R2_9BURK|nr:DUF4214 domain-containing protein [Duganella sacchari]SHN42623.1 S-layer protein [Duganella sacchari]